MNCLVSDMLAIADEKYLQMVELLKLTEEQTTCLAEEDVEKLERYVGCRQSIIDRINSLDARYGELKAQLMKGNNADGLEALKGEIDVQKIIDLNVKTKSIIRKTIEIDKKNAEMGKQLLEKLGEALAQANKAPAAHRAYHSNLSGAIFINRQG